MTITLKNNLPVVDPVGVRVADIGGAMRRLLGTPVVPIKQEDPIPVKALEERERVNHMLKRQTEWRVQMALGEMKSHQCAWFVTLTYADDSKASKLDVVNLIKRYRHFGKAQQRAAEEFLAEVEAPWYTEPVGASKSVNRAALRASVEHDPRGRVQYLIVKEWGSERGRVHWHAVVIFPHRVKWRDFDSEPLLRWNQGFTHRKLIENGLRSSRYLSKYIGKDNGRMLCSYNFGLTTIITLLSNASFHRLALASLKTAQRLQRRLSLTPSYPTSKLMTYLMSRVKSLTTSQPLANRRQAQTKIGVICSGETKSNERTWSKAVESDSAGSACTALGPANTSEVRLYLGQSPGASRKVVESLLRECVIELRAAQARGLFERCADLVGLRTFGRRFRAGGVIAAVDFAATDVWRAKVADPERNHRRAGAHWVRMGERRGHTGSLAAGVTRTYTASYAPSGKVTVEEHAGSRNGDGIPAAFAAGAQQKAAGSEGTGVLSEGACVG